MAKFLFKNSSTNKQKAKRILFLFFVIVLNRKFLKCIYDVRELFSSDESTYKNLAKFGDYLREIQTLFSVSYEKENLNSK